MLIQHVDLLYLPLIIELHLSFILVQVHKQDNHENTTILLNSCKKYNPLYFTSKL